MKERLCFAVKRHVVITLAAVCFLVGAIHIEAHEIQLQECDSSRGYCVNEGECSVPTFRLRTNKCPLVEKVCCPKRTFPDEFHKKIIKPETTISTPRSITTTVTPTATASSVITTTTSTPSPYQSNASVSQENQFNFTTNINSTHTDATLNITGSQVNEAVTKDAADSEKFNQSSNNSQTTFSSKPVEPASTDNVKPALKVEFSETNFTFQGCGHLNPGGVLTSTLNQDSRAEYGEFPWMVALFQRNLSGLHYCCNGALISNKTVLTTTYCITRCGGQALFIEALLGEWNISSPRAMAIQRKNIWIKKIHRLNPPSASSLALLELNYFVTYHPTIQPVCEPSSTYAIKSTDNMIATGWDTKIDSPQILKRLDLQYNMLSSYKQTDCEAAYGVPVVMEIPGTSNRYYLYGLATRGCNKGVKLFNVLKLNLSELEDLQRKFLRNSPF